MLLKLATRLMALKQDRGEGPVPYLILVAVVAAVAVGIGAAIQGLADTWIANIVDEMP